MDAPLPTTDALIRPWRTATLVASLVAAIELVLLVGAAGLLLAGAIAATFTVQPWWRGAVRQLCFGSIAAGATYLVGILIGVNAAG